MLASKQADEAVAVSLDDVARLTSRVNVLTNEKVQDIRKITGRMRMLALNAMIEAARAGHAGAGFSVVAQEVRGIGGEVERVAGTLEQELVGQITQLERLTQLMSEQAQGMRLVDLALNAIEIIDRNLYERTCDVRWWATDSAVVDCVAMPDDASSAYACQRLGVILDAYTVYLDLWLCDMKGRVVASGRPDRYAVIGADVSREPWFQKAAKLASGDDYVVDDITSQPLLSRAMTATYAASVRAGGRSNGAPIGVLGVHFDWEPQARTIVESVRLSDEQKARSRVMLLDAARRVIASSDGRGLLTETVTLDTQGRDSGFYHGSDGSLVAFHATPGYETYRGLGWYGVIVQKGD
jgi:hypothetical protein